MKVKLRLAAVLKDKQISKYQFAKLLGRPNSNVYTYLKKDYNPTLSTLAKWATILECQISDLYEEK